MSDVKPLLFLSRDDVIKLLGEAFDEGNKSYQDLKESSIENILDVFLEERKKKSNIPTQIKLEPEVRSFWTFDSTVAMDVIASSANLGENPAICISTTS